MVVWKFCALDEELFTFKAVFLVVLVTPSR